MQNLKLPKIIWERGFVLFFPLLCIIFHVILYNKLEFHRDELLYFSLGIHPDFGYHSVPPLIGLFAFISAKIFGYSLFAAKFLPAIAGGTIVYLALLITKELKGSIFAQIMTAIGLMGSILFVRAFGLFQPVVFDILFWTLIIFLVIKYVNTDSMKYIYCLGIAAGVSFLNKYNTLFLILPLFAVLPFTKHRILFSEKKFYFSFLIALLIILPNIIWQWTNDFPVIDHMRELRENQLVNMNPVTFLSEQLLMIIPGTLIALPGLIYLISGKALKRYRFLGFTIILVILLFLIMQGKSYYTAGIYPFLMATGGIFFEKVFTRKYLRIVLVLILITLMWIFLPMGKPIYSPQKMVEYFDMVAEKAGNDAIRRFEDNQYHQLPQDYADMLGWNELTSITYSAWQKIENKTNAIIYAENYGQAGAITIIGKQYGLPEAISFSDNFLYWIPKTFKTEITEGIYINDELGVDISLLFDDIKEIGRIENPLARESGTRVYLFKKPNKSFNRFWEERIKEID